MKQARFVVIFLSTLNDLNDMKYQKWSEEMHRLVQDQPGFLGMESFRKVTGEGVTLSYWDSKRAIEAWKNNSRHRIAQQYGKNISYKKYTIRICEIQKEYSF